MTDFSSAIAKVDAGIDLTTSEMEQLVGSMLAEEVDVDSPQADLVRKLLLGLRQKGETTGELVGAARAMRARMTPIQIDASLADSTASAEARTGAGAQASNQQTGNGSTGILLDTCGTGGSGSGTFNISTAAAIVISACDVRVAKHGNRKATSRSGSADVLAELGVRIESERSVVKQSLEQLNICFCFAPMLHPAMRHVGAIRRSLSVPTMFNLLGPLCNPAGATHQLLGTGRADVQQKLAEALAQLGTHRSIVVRGEDGQDEVSLDGITTAIEVRHDGTLKTHQWTAATFGLTPASTAAMQATDPAESAQIIRGIFDGLPGPCRDIVIANAAAGLWLVGKCETLLEAAELAAKTIDSGLARQQLSRFAAFTTGQAGDAVDKGLSVSQPTTGKTKLGESIDALTNTAATDTPAIVTESGVPTHQSAPELRFSERAIELAAELKRAGLAWQPEPGHFVYDSDGVLPHTSPFQDHVFFILELKHFLRYAGSVQQLTERMTWLPAWWDARKWLRDSGMDDATVADLIHARKGITRGEELVLLYEMILERLN